MYWMDNFKKKNMDLGHIKASYFISLCTKWLKPTKGLVYGTVTCILV